MTENIALLIDFGSTFTKVTAVDLHHARIVARAQSPSTVLTDVCIGLLSALERLHDYQPIFATKPRDLSALDGFFVRASSSAAGGLRIVVIGLVPGLTVQAANAAALGAGGKIVGTFAFKLGERQIAEIAALKPDIILLTGGTDGGDSQTIVHNGALLAASAVSVPFVVAGNRMVAEQVRAALAAAGKEACCADNVMPTGEDITPHAAQGEIRRFFMRRIIEGKGLDKVQSLVHIVQPTPMAVLKAAELGAQGTAEHPGWGELLMLDVGGATTDVYSVGDGRQTELDTIPKGLPEPFAKRTVEGDLGIRSNAATILKRVGADNLYGQFTALFPEHAASRAQVLDYVASLNDQPDRVPVEPWQSATDATLARLAVDLAIERHVGRKEPYYSSGGTIFLQTGKDMTETPTLVGTGGVFTYNAYADRILAGGVQHRERYDVLRPEAPSVVLDRNYILYSIGLLADSHPQVALQIFQDQLNAGHAVGPAPGAAAGEIVSHGHAHGHGAGHECC